jgi:hypothetical protein
LEAAINLFARTSRQAHEMYLRVGGGRRAKKPDEREEAGEQSLTCIQVHLIFFVKHTTEFLTQVYKYV